MPIHDRGYRHYSGERLPPGRAWIVIARTGIRMLLGRRAFVVLLLLAWFPFFVRAVQIYAATNLPSAAFLAPTPQMFRQFLGQQEIFVFFVAVYAGAGLIANDRRANALQIYLSKPLGRGEYVVGKLTVLLVYLLFVTWLPAIVLLVIQVTFSGSFAFVSKNVHLVPAITVFSMIQALTVSLAVLALSSLSNSSRYVGILYTALLFFSQAIYGVLYALTRDSRLAWISVPSDLAQVGDLVFRVPLSYRVSPGISGVVLIGLAVAALAILERRVRAVEVVT